MESRVDSARILEILTQSKPANKEDPNYNYYKQLAMWAEPGRTQAGKEIILDKTNTAIKISDRSLIDKNPTKLAKRYNNLGALLSALKNLMDQEGRYNPNNAASKLIQKTAVEILASLSGKYPKKEQTNLRQGMDWTAEKARRLANANGAATSDILEKFYNDYYKIEYAGLSSPTEEDSTGIVAQLKNLDKILIQEFNKLGYNPVVNPLAQYLKILIKEKPTIFKKLTPNTYGAIHNSFIDGSLKGNTLGNYNAEHLLFCEDLYNRKGLEMVKYLQLYKQTYEAAEGKTNETETQWSLAAKVFIQQVITSDSESEEGQQKTFADSVKALRAMQEVVMPDSPKAKLRSLSEIEELHTYIFGKAPAAEKTTEKEVITTIVSGVKVKKAMLDMMHYIANLKQFSKVYSDKSDQVKRMLGPDGLKFTPNDTNTEYCKMQLMTYKDELTVADLLAIMQKCLAVYNKSKAKK